jgi:hypothetical protein
MFACCCPISLVKILGITIGIHSLRKGVTISTDLVSSIVFDKAEITAKLHVPLARLSGIIKQEPGC